MNIKVAIGVVAALVVAGGAFYYFGGSFSSTDAMQQQGETTYSWTLKELPEKDGVPQTEVALNGRVVGTYQGSCSQIEGSSWTLLAGEQSGVICWFAGGGKEIGLFANEDGGYDVLEGDLDEGSAETPGMRGNFKILFIL